MLIVLIGTGLVVGGVLQTEHTNDRIRQLMATGDQVEATATGGAYGRHVKYVAHGRTWTVTLLSAWGTTPSYPAGTTVTIYVSPTEPYVVATRDGYLTAEIESAFPFALMSAGVCVLLLAKPDLSARISRARARRSGQQRSA